MLDEPTTVCPDCGNHYYGEMKYFSPCNGEGVIWHIVDSTSRRLADPDYKITDPYRAKLYKSKKRR